MTSGHQWTSWGKATGQTSEETFVVQEEVKVAVMKWVTIKIAQSGEKLRDRVNEIYCSGSVGGITCQRPASMGQGKLRQGAESVIDHLADFSLREQSLIHWGQ